LHPADLRCGRERLRRSSVIERTGPGRAWSARRMNLCEPEICARDLGYRAPVSIRPVSARGARSNDIRNPHTDWRKVVSIHEACPQGAAQDDLVSWPRDEDFRGGDASGMRYLWSCQRPKGYSNQPGHKGHCEPAKPRQLAPPRLGRFLRNDLVFVLPCSARMKRGDRGASESAD
jgi:hypothetical protein